MKKFILLSLILFSPFISSQESNVNNNARLDIAGDLNVGNSGIWLKPPSHDKVKGTYYLFDSWVNLAKIISDDGKIFTIKNINLDTRQHRFVAKTSTDSVFVFSTKTIKKINVNNTVFKLYDTGNAFYYYELIAFGKGKEILKKSEKKIKKGAKDPFTNSYKQDQLVLKTEYYFNSKEGLKEIVFKKKSFLKLFGEDALKIKKIISKNKLSIKKDSDLVKIFELYKKK